MNRKLPKNRDQRQPALRQRRVMAPEDEPLTEAQIILYAVVIGLVLIASLLIIGSMVYKAMYAPNGDGTITQYAPLYLVEPSAVIEA